MAYSTALEEEEEAGWQCCMPPRGSFGVLSPSQGAAEGVRSRDIPRWVEYQASLPSAPRQATAHRRWQKVESSVWGVASGCLCLWGFVGVVLAETKKPHARVNQEVASYGALC